MTDESEWKLGQTHVMMKKSHGTSQPFALCSLCISWEMLHRSWIPRAFLGFLGHFAILWWLCCQCVCFGWRYCELLHLNDKFYIKTPKTVFYRKLCLCHQIKQRIICRWCFFDLGAVEWQGLTLIRAWMSNDKTSKVWYEITYPSAKLQPLYIWSQEWISNFHTLY